MYRSEYVHERIKLICSVSGDEEHHFTPLQLDLINSLKSGLLPSEIAKNRGMETPGVYGQIARCAEKIESIRNNDCIAKTSPGNWRKDIAKKIDLLSHIPESEYEIFHFTQRQLELMHFLKGGMTAKEIAEKCGTSTKSVYALIAACTSKVLNPHPAKESSKRCHQPVEKKTRKSRYQQFADADLSVLREREREILSFRIAHPELSLQQIADIHGITYKTCAKTLSSAARRLLDGEYVSEKRYLGKETTKAHYKEKMRQWWENNREQMLERQREYNKTYYQQNRDRLLEKSRSQDSINAARLAEARKTLDGYMESTSLSPEQFSEMFGVPLKTIKSWYSGRRDLPGWAVKQIMDKLEGQ